MKTVYSPEQISIKANLIREDIIEMLLKAGSGHAAGPLGMADIFATLYFSVLNYDSSRPEWADRDRLVVSNGHICPVMYAALAEAHYFPKEWLWTLRQLGSPLQGHPNHLEVPGVETSSGPLGQGISQAVGMALAGKMDQKNYQVYCVMSDGEHDEGQVWEAALSASKYKLHNLAVIIDRNNIQIDGFTEDIMPLESIKAKYEAFNWHVLEIDGHNIREVIDACNEAKSIYEKPVAIIAHTIPGKGVEFMEWKPEWHGKAPNKDEAKLALRELRSLGGKINQSK